MRGLAAPVLVIVALGGCGGGPSDDESLQELAGHPPLVVAVSEEDLERFSDAPGSVGELTLNGRSLDAPPYEGALHEMTRQYLAAEHGENTLGVRGDIARATDFGLTILGADDPDFLTRLEAIETDPGGLLRFYTEYMEQQGHDREIDGSLDVPAVGRAMHAWAEAYPDLVSQLRDDEYAVITWDEASEDRVLAAMDRAG